MQLTQMIEGKQCPGPAVAMEVANDGAGAGEACERSAKGQVKRPNRPEHVRAFEFLKVHYEEDLKAEVPIQKSDVYMEYQRYCTRNKLKPLVAADFGRILKSVFPNAKDRRLGSRGCSKYCYVGVKRRSRTGATDSTAAACSQEDVCKACELLICEWASTVLSRRIKSNHELAKYLLKNRFVQTRSCAALTLTVSLGESGELDDIPPMNKHRETQLKLQEKLRERLLMKQNKERTGSLDESELSLGQHVEGTSSQLPSRTSSPDIDAQRMQKLMQTHSAPGSSSASPEHNVQSVNSSACASPVFSDTVIHKPLYPINYQRSGCDVLTERKFIPATTPTSIHSQCDSAVGSERSTPIAPQYNNIPQPVHYMYDHRIQSCPTTPLPSYQQQSFDFTQQVINRAPPQCMSLPGSARNTPVIPDYQDANGVAYHADQHRAPPADIYQQNFTGTQFSQNMNLSGFQRVEFGRENSAFAPIKDGGELQQASDLNLGQPYGNKTGELAEQATLNNDSDELEINEILDFIENRNSSDTAHNSGQLQNGANTMSAVDVEDRFRSLSAQGPLSQGTCQRPSHLQSNPVTSTNSVIYNLLISGPNHNTSADSGRFRHHSGPQLGYASSQKLKHIGTPGTVSRHISTGSAHMAVGSTVNMSAGSPCDVYSPPSTPNGNFRPVHDPSREMRSFYGAEAQPGASSTYSVRSANSSPAGLHVPARINNSLVGTMSPPAQPLKRKRNISGERIPSSLVGRPHTATKPLPATSMAQPPDYVAKRSLGSRLSSPVVFNDGSQSNGL